MYRVKWHLDERVVLKGDDTWFPVMKTEGKFHRGNTMRQKYVQRWERKTNIHWALCCFPVASITNYNKLGGFNKIKIYCFTVLGLGFQNPLLWVYIKLLAVLYSLQSTAEINSLPLPVSDSCWHSLDYAHIPPICLLGFITLSSSVFVFSSFLHFFIF